MKMLSNSPSRACVWILALSTLASGSSLLAQSGGSNRGFQASARTEDSRLSDRVSRLFSRPAQQVQRQTSRPVTQQYRSTRPERQYEPASTYVSTYVPTQQVPQKVVLRNRSADRGTTVIYQAPRYGESGTPAVRNEDPRILQPGESMTITDQGTVFHSTEVEERPTNHVPSSSMDLTLTGTSTAPQAAPQITQPVSQPAAPPKAVLDKESLPVAKWAGTFTKVISPYPPHHELDVSGLPSGSLARDPVSKLIFRLP